MIKSCLNDKCPSLLFCLDFRSEATRICDNMALHRLYTVAVSLCRKLFCFGNSFCFDDYASHGRQKLGKASKW